LGLGAGDSSLHYVVLLFFMKAYSTDGQDENGGALMSSLGAECSSPPLFSEPSKKSNQPLF